MEKKSGVEDEEHEDNNNDTTSSSNECPPHLQKNEKQTARNIESNHAPNSYSSNIEVSEEYIDIANKTIFNYFIYIEVRMRMQ